MKLLHRHSFYFKICKAEFCKWHVPRHVSDRYFPTYTVQYRDKPLTDYV